MTKQDLTNLQDFTSPDHDFGNPIEHPIAHPVIAIEAGRLWLQQVVAIDCDVRGFIYAPIKSYNLGPFVLQ